MAELTKADCCHLAAKAIFEALETRPLMIKSAFAKCGLLPVSADALVSQLSATQRSPAHRSAGAAPVVDPAPVAVPEQPAARIDIAFGTTITFAVDATPQQRRDVVREAVSALNSIDSEKVVAAVAKEVAAALVEEYIQPRRKLLVEMTVAKKERDAKKTRAKRSYNTGTLLTGDEHRKALREDQLEEEKKKAEAAESKALREAKKQAKLADEAAKAAAKAHQAELKAKEDEERAAKKRKREEDAALAQQQHDVAAASSSEVNKNPYAPVRHSYRK